MSLATSHTGTLMNPSRRVGSRAPLGVIVAVLLGLLTALLPGTALAADWTTLKRVTDERVSRLDSLHQLSSARGRLHLVHPRVGPSDTDDRVFYQRSDDDGATWTEVIPLFSATASLRTVAPNLALAAAENVVVVAWRVSGPDGSTLFVRVSRDGGDSFEGREVIFSTRHEDGIGVPAVAVGAGGKLVSVAWTDRSDGRITLRSSRDAGRTFGEARTLGRTNLSIDCRGRLIDGLVGLAASDRDLHIAWSEAPRGRCQASRIEARSSGDGGRTWSEARTISAQRSYGWPELDARGRIVLATVQATTGDLILARSADAGRSWSDRLLRAPKGSSFSAADTILMSNERAMLAYTVERIRKARLLSTKVVSRWSPDAGGSFRQPRVVAPEAERLRMAPNLASSGRQVAIVLQSGPMSGSPRHLYVSRQR
jgi:hypothetical protein